MLTCRTSATRSKMQRERIKKKKILRMSVAIAEFMASGTCYLSIVTWLGNLGVLRDLRLHNEFLEVTG